MLQTLQFVLLSNVSPLGNTSNTADQIIS